MKRKVLDFTALDDEGKAYLLARDVVKAAPANVNLGQAGVLDYINHRQYPRHRACQSTPREE